MEPPHLGSSNFKIAETGKNTTDEPYMTGPVSNHTLRKGVVSNYKPEGARVT